MDGQQRRKQRSREKIVRTALGLFAAGGIRRVSVEEIARKAGVNPVTIYNHFESKNGLVLEVVRHLVDDHWARFRSILQEEAPFVDKLERIVSLKQHMADLASGDLIRHAIADDGEIRETINSLFENEIDPLLVKLLKSGQREGAVRSDLSVDALRIYIDMFTDVARAHPELFAGPGRLSKTTREIWSLFLHGLSGTGPRGPSPRHGST
jgi:AcrR family transcriptional regulator